MPGIADASYDGETSPVLSIRSWLRCFAEAVEDSKLVEWEHTLDGQYGGGARVALLDGGLDWELPVFGGAALLPRDFTDSRDLGEHAALGTAHASLLVGQAGGGFEGLMPYGELLYGRVLWPGSRDDSARAVARGLHWAAACGADVIILPFGLANAWPQVAEAIRWAARSGATIVAAARNEGLEVSFPACLDEVTGVTGIDIGGRPVVRCCTVERVDLAAPGSQVPGMGPQGSVSLGGSSPAAVIAGGILALRQAALRNSAAEAVVARPSSVAANTPGNLGVSAAPL